MHRLRLAFLASLAVVPAVLTAQLKVDVQLVDVVATVTDSRGRYVSDLGPDDFIVREDGEMQKVAYLTQSSDLPVSVGLTLDSSGSMERKMSTATDAVERFIRSVHRDDDIFLMTFSDRPLLVQPFTNSRERLAAALRSVRVGGETALYDAVAASLQEIRGGLHRKRAILLITDGQDTASLGSFDEALLAIRTSELLVYCLGISPDNVTGIAPASTVPPIITEDPSNRRPPIPFPIPGGPGIPIPGIPGIPGTTPFPRLPLTEPQRQPLPGGGTITVSDSVDMTVLDRFAEDSGGRAWLLSGGWNQNRGSEINAVLDQIASELRSQYTISYYPSHPIKDGKFHSVEITARDKSLHVRARKEYFGR